MSETGSLPPKKDFVPHIAEIIADERAAIATRECRTNRDLTGLALSGGGIRSASFCLGVLQALHAHKLMNGIDYISTVSGGGYVGSCLSVCQSRNGHFPYRSAETTAAPSLASGDTPAVRHIRDFSNYLIPRGRDDIITAIGIVMRGILANSILVLSVALFAAWVTLLVFPCLDALDNPPDIFKAVFGIDFPRMPNVVRHFQIAISLLCVGAAFLFLWAFVKSAVRSNPSELSGWFPGLFKTIFVLTILGIFIDLQPVALILMRQHPSAGAGSQIAGSIARVLPYIAAILGPILTVFGRELAVVSAKAKCRSGFLAVVRRLSATAGIYLAAALLPLLIWCVYIRITYLGMRHGDEKPPLPSFMGISSFFDRAWLTTHVPTVYFLSSLVLFGLAILINRSATSLFGLYRDRLSKAFLFDPETREKEPTSEATAQKKKRWAARAYKLEDTWGDLLPLDSFKLSDIDPKRTPFHIINAALNIEGSPFANKRGRNADFLTFSCLYIGSEATGYARTKQLEDLDSRLNLGTAMAVSAAAVSPNMGAATIKPLTLSLALLNVRLGYWLYNPRLSLTTRLARILKRAQANPLSLFLSEMFGRLRPDNDMIYLTDGGNIENLGLYQLIQRRCSLIIVVDAEADPEMRFSSLLVLQRFAAIDFGTHINLPWRALQRRTLEVGHEFAKDRSGMDWPRYPGPHCAVGTIAYENGPPGRLVYVKSSFTGDEEDYVIGYKRRYPEFPHETTSDQFFGEEQFEAYRALGFHAMSRMLTDEPFAVDPNPGEEPAAACARIRQEIFDVLRGADQTAAG